MKSARINGIKGVCHQALAVRELDMQSRLAWNSQRSSYLGLDDRHELPCLAYEVFDEHV
ncbi:hypothetical protein I79_026135 [Cricetulus griseus]|uniref:Uncharacterized protein n=1 Tax=Cricetulus griseus TaxID=10029 RepID=G3IQ45_CRIGR|nr:hypothetical protein I79_026135 [Cricetulus griseus]